MEGRLVFIDTGLHEGKTAVIVGERPLYFDLQLLDGSHNGTIPMPHSHCVLLDDVDGQQRPSEMVRMPVRADDSREAVKQIREVIGSRVPPTDDFIVSVYQANACDVESTVEALLNILDDDSNGIPSLPSTPENSSYVPSSASNKRRSEESVEALMRREEIRKQDEEYAESLRRDREKAEKDKKEKEKTMQVERGKSELEQSFEGLRIGHGDTRDAEELTPEQMREKRLRALGGLLPPEPNKTKKAENMTSSTAKEALPTEPTVSEDSKAHFSFKSNARPFASSTTSVSKSSSGSRASPIDVSSPLSRSGNECFFDAPEMSKEDEEALENLRRDEEYARKLQEAEYEHSNRNLMNYYANERHTNQGDSGDILRRERNRRRSTDILRQGTREGTIDMDDFVYISDDGDTSDALGLLPNQEHSGGDYPGTARSPSRALVRRSTSSSSTRGPRSPSQAVNTEDDERIARELQEKLEREMEDERIARELQRSEDYVLGEDDAAHRRNEFDDGVFGAMGITQQERLLSELRRRLAHQGGTPRSSACEKMNETVVSPLLPPQFQHLFQPNPLFAATNDYDSDDGDYLAPFGGHPGFHFAPPGFAPASYELQDVPTPVSQTMLDRLPVFNYNGENLSDTQCSICLSDFSVGDELRRLSCLHVFHKDCIDRWFEGKNRCPVCQEEMK